jgi:imidazolonepropionase-like amidohydrolase
MSARTGLLLLVLTLLPGLGAAADRIVLHDVRLIDGNGGVPREHLDVAIEGERIAAVGSHLSGGRVVNLAGKSVLPGLISDHSHLGLTDGTKVSGDNATQANILRQLRQYLAYGVTTVMSLGLNQQSFYDLQPKLHAGSLPGSDFFGADRGFGVPDGAPPAGAGILDSQVYRPKDEAEARQEVRETAARHPALIKMWVDDFHGAMKVKISPDVQKAILDEAHRQGIRVAAHVFYLDDAKRLIDEGIDVLAHGVRDQPVDQAFINALKRRGVWYIPTVGLDETSYLFAEHPELLSEPILAHALQPALAAQLKDPAWRSKVLGDAKKLKQDHGAVDVNLANLKKLEDAGVKIGFGSDSGATVLRIAGFAEHHELSLLVRAGLTPLQAITTATKNAAALLQLDDRGSIEPGKRADLLIVEGDPASDIRAVDAIAEVWQRGKRVSGALAEFSP